jgi:hypothetical protein
LVGKTGHQKEQNIKRIKIPEQNSEEFDCGKSSCGSVYMLV